MRVEYKILSLIVICLLLGLLFYTKLSWKVTENLARNESKEEKTRRNVSETYLPIPPPPEEKVEKEENITIVPIKGGLGGKWEIEEQKEIEVDAKIVDICSGKLKEIKSVTEGLQVCLNKEAPYYIILERNSTHLKTSFYYGGFNQTFNFTNDTLIFYVFIENLKEEEPYIEGFIASGNASSFISLGEPYYAYSWEKIEGKLVKKRVMAILPIFVKYNFEVNRKWNDLIVSLRINRKLYQIGICYVFTKEI